ncbi:MAG: DUF4143 domain-containing protein [Eubacteriales bacterium]|nr:DUF4143 domain-containing protein [Eubacteriales bacterium]
MSQTFERKLYEKLVSWKEENSGASALLLDGPHAMGKSFIVEAFARENYRSVMFIDFAQVSSYIKNLFLNFRDDPVTLLNKLAKHYKIAIYPRETLLVLDSIQTFPAAREAINKLCSDRRCDIIELGAGVSVRENIKDINLPSAEIAFRLFPMDFEEFCIALGEGALASKIRERFQARKPLSAAKHSRAMRLFKTYLIVGGMPGAVTAFANNAAAAYTEALSAAASVKHEIAASLKKDIDSIPAKYKARVASLYEQLPLFLSQSDKHVRFRHIVKGTYAYQYEDTFNWLSDSGLAYICRRTENPKLGLYSLNESDSFVKAYMSDTGLLADAVLKTSANSFIEDEHSPLDDILYENAAAAALSTNGHKLFYYSRYNDMKHRNDIDIDFLITDGTGSRAKIIPIEIKCGKRYSSRTLPKFIELYHSNISESFVVCKKNLKIKDSITYIPPYMLFCI